MTLPKKPNRQPEGVPIGGEFAPTAHAEPDVTLAVNEPHFTEDPNLAAGLTYDGDTGDDAKYDFLGESNGSGNGGQPPRAGGSGGSGEDGERRKSQVIFTDAFKALESKLENAKHIGLTTNAYGKIRVEHIYDADLNSLDDYSGRLADSLNSQINQNAPGGRAILAEHIIGNRKSATIDAQAAIGGQIRIQSLPPLS